MRVLTIYNQQVLAAGHPEADSEEEIVGTAETVNKILVRAGFDVRCLAIGRDLEILNRELLRRRPDVVFNLFEGLADQPSTEIDVASILERECVPLTGNASNTLRLALGKHTTKQLLLEAGLPTPCYRIVERPPTDVRPLRWPVIVKPALEDASIGIDQGSVVTDLLRLQLRVEKLIRRFGPPVLIEEYIAGREFTVALIDFPETVALPAIEILFRATDAAYWPIVTYDGKWMPGSADYEATPPCYGPRLESILAQRLADLSIEAYRLLGCRDYARVDFRMDRAGQQFILEVNPNPDFSPIACLAGSLAASGRSYEEFTVELVKNAFARKVQAGCKISGKVSRSALRQTSPSGRVGTISSR